MDSVLKKSWCKFCMERLQKHFFDVCHRHAPLLTKKVHGYQNPWMTSAISNLMKSRDFYLRKVKKSGWDEDWDSYRLHRNKVTAATRNAKSDYNRNLIQENLDDSRSFWKIMKKLFPNKSSSSGSINQLKFDGELITDKENIAGCFCKYFSEI